MTILHNRLPSDPYGITDKFLSIPHRTFVWIGERYPEDLKLADGVTLDPKAGKAKWCFKYGEKEWREGINFTRSKENAEGDPLAQPAIAPIGRVDCLTGVSI